MEQSVVKCAVINSDVEFENRLQYATKCPGYPAITPANLKHFNSF